MKDRLGKLLTRKLIENPVFVVGMGRSGTTVLLNALGQHPLVLGALGEAPLIPSFGLVVEPLEHSQERDYYREGLNTPMAYLYEGLRRTCFETVFGPHFGLDRSKTDLRSQDGLGILRRIRWCAKTFPSSRAYDGLRQIFPGAAFVYIVRNGIEMVHSRTRFSGFSEQSFEEQCQAWVAGITTFGYLADAEAAIVVRHETLVDDPDRVMRAVFDVARITYDPRPTTYVQQTLLMPLGQRSEFGVDVRAALKGRRPAYESWTTDQRTTFERVAGDAMEAMGYQIPF